MSGIVVGIDASSHSMAALNWAMRAAAARKVPLNVVTVEVVVASGWGGSQVYGTDFSLRDKAQKAAEEAVASVTKTLGDAVQAYRADVESGAYPGEKYSFHD